MDLKSKFKKNNSCIYRKLNNVDILFKADTNEICKLNETGIFIWNNINSSNSVKDILYFIKEKFEVNNKKIEDEVISFINYLKKNKLIYELDQKKH